MISFSFFRSKSSPCTGKVVVRALDEVYLPDHLEIVEMIMGLTELVPKSYISRDKSSEKHAAEQGMDPLGIIYPGILRKMYQIPAKYDVNKQSSFGVIEFQDDTSFSKQDLTSFNQGMNENVVVSKIVGPYSGDSPDGESTLDVQVSNRDFHRINSAAPLIFPI